MDNERGVATLCPTAYQREKDSARISPSVLFSCFWSNKWAAKRRCHDDRWTMSYSSLFLPISLSLSLSLYLSLSLSLSRFFSRLSIPRIFLFLPLTIDFLFFSLSWGRARARVWILSSLGISYLLSFSSSISIFVRVPLSL